MVQYLTEITHAMKRWQFWLGILISLIFLYFALKGLKIEEMWNSIKNARYGWLLPGVAVYFLGVYARAWRWHYLLRPLKPIPTQVMFPIVAVGYMGNNIYPARAGEILRAIVLKKREQVPISASLATIIVERVFDGVVMLGFIFVNLSELAQLTHGAAVIGEASIQQVAMFGSLLFGTALLIFLAAAMFPQFTHRLVRGTIQRIAPSLWREKLIHISERFLNGLESLRSPLDALMVFFTSVVIWLLETGKYWFVMHAFNFEVSFFALMLMNGVVNLATTIPSAPGYIGTFDAPGIAVLVAYGVNKAVAASYTIVLHVALWFPITALGAFYLAREGIHWNEALQTQAKENT